MRRLLIGLVTLLSITGVAPARAADHADGTTAISSGSGSQYEPSIAVDPITGDLIVAWTDSRSGTPETRASRSTNGGATWTPIEVIEGPNGPGSEPTVEFANGTWYLTNVTPSGAVNFSRFSDDYTQFLTPIDPTGNGAGNRVGADLAVSPNGQNLFVAFQNDDGGSSVYVNRSTNGGANWQSTPVLVDAGGMNPSIILDGANPHVFFVYPVSPFAGVWHSFSTDGGVTFSSPNQVTPLNVTNSGDLGITNFPLSPFPVPALTPDGRLVVAYEDNPVGSDPSDIFFRFSDDAGATWSEQVRLNETQTGSIDLRPSVEATSSDELVALLFEFRRDLNAYLATRTGIDGTTVQPAVPVTPLLDAPEVADDTGIVPASEAFFLRGQLAIAPNGDVHVMWGDTRNDNRSKIRAGAFSAESLDDAIDLAIESLAGGPELWEPILVDLGVPTGFGFLIHNVGSTPVEFPSVQFSGTLPIVEVTQGDHACVNIAALMGRCMVGNMVVGATRTLFGTFVANSPGAEEVLWHALGFGNDAAPSNNSGGFIFDVRGSSLPSSATTGSVSTPIPDNATLDLELPITGQGNLIDVQVGLRLNHPATGQLDVTLESPEGTQVPLATDVGGSGDNFGSSSNACPGNLTIFGPNASSQINAGASPFVGTFRPEGTLAELFGEPVNGTWRLHIADDTIGDTGTLGCWKLDLSRTGGSFVFPSAPFTVNESAGNAVVQVNRIGDPSATQSVQVSTEPGSASSGDFTPLVGQVLTFNPGETTKTIQVPIIDDSTVEPAETITVTLHDPTNGSTIGARSEASISIDASDRIFRPDGRIRLSGDSSYIGNNVYNANAANQTRRAGIRLGGTKVFQVSVENDGNVAQAYTLDGVGNGGGIRVRYFNGATNITNNVINGSFQTPSLGIGGTHVYRIVMNTLSSARSGSMRAALLEIRSVVNNNRVDAVKAVVEVP
jgi:subtilisin-like proprotein convertase family protein